MGEYRERDAQGKNDFSGLNELEERENNRDEYQGTIDIEGVDEMLEEIRKEDPEPSQSPETPDEILEDKEIDFEAIRLRAQHTYFLNSQDHLVTPKYKNLELDISADYEKMTDALMGYLENEGIDGLHKYVSGELENENHWANLAGLGLIEGEQNLSTLGEYVTNQVFEYSD